MLFLIAFVILMSFGMLKDHGDLDVGVLLAAVVELFIELMILAAYVN